MAKKNDKEASSSMGKVSAPPDTKMKAFSTSDDVEETGRLWSKWKKELTTRFRYFRIENDEDRIDALNIYGGELIEELINTLPDVQTSESSEAVQSEYDKVIAKLDNYFTPLVNIDGARSKFAEMSQNIGEAMSQYHVRLRTQAVKCNFPDISDAIRSKILQSMRDGVLRREAMVKNYTLHELLKHAANKEDIERQAKCIEQSLQANKQDVRPVYEKKRIHGTRTSNLSREGSRNSADSSSQGCTNCGLSHGISRQCPAKGKKCLNCSKMGHYARMCRSQKGKSKQQSKFECPYKSREKSNAFKVNTSDCIHSSFERTEQDSSSDSDFVFHTKTNASNKRVILPTVEVKINGVKGRVEADSCSTVNIIDEEKFQRLQNASTNKIKIGTTNTEVYPYGQEKPLSLVGCFETEIESLGTGNKIRTNFLVAKGNTNSRPLLSLETSVELGVLMIANALQPSPTLPTQTVVFNQPSPTRTDQAQLKTSGTIDNLVDAYQDVFTGLGKHKKIKARLIVDESVIPVVHKQRKIPYNLHEKAKREEQRLVEMGIIEAVPDDQPTTWCTNPVIAPKHTTPKLSDTVLI